MVLITTFPPLVQNLPVRFPRMAETKQDISHAQIHDFISLQPMQTKSFH